MLDRILPLQEPVWCPADMYHAVCEPLLHCWEPAACRHEHLVRCLRYA
jgi:hypothetical protein